MTPLEGSLLFLSGIAAGFVNTVAGGGSILCLPILVELYGAGVANGTNRVAILLQNLAGVAWFAKSGKVPWRAVAPVVPPLIAGAAAGAYVAVIVSPEAMRRVFAVVVLFVAVSALVKPSRWLAGSEKQLAEPWRALAFFGIGFYGGFVQAGVGFLLLMGLVLGGGLDLVRGNAAKVALVLLYTPVTVLFFAGGDQIEWLAGIVLGAGSVTGAVLGASLSIRKGAPFIRWVLVAAALGAAAHMIFG